MTRLPLLALALLLALAAPATARAHAVVFPRQSTPGAYEKYVLRVPNERGVATTRVELRFPAGVRVVSFGDVQGWSLEILRDSAQRIVGAVWTGTLPPERFVELPFVAVNPKEAARLVWPAFQSYAGGERVEWTGPEDAKTPASATEISASAAPSSGTPAAPTPSDRTPLFLSGAALLVAIIGLGVALRK